MSSQSVIAGAVVRPPRKNGTGAVVVDGLARAYDITGLSMAGVTPSADGTVRAEVFLTVQADGGDVCFYFDTTGGTSGLTTGAAVVAGGTLAFGTQYSARLVDGAPPLRLRIDRSKDKFLHLMAASGTPVLRFWVSSDAEA